MILSSSVAILLSLATFGSDLVIHRGLVNISIVPRVEQPHLQDIGSYWLEVSVYLGWFPGWFYPADLIVQFVPGFLRSLMKIETETES
jgi:hypothetical protein